MLDANLSVVTPVPPAAPLPFFLKWIGKVVDGMVIAIGAALAILIFSNVVMHAFGKDFAWMTELGEFLMVWVTFFGGACAAQRGAHMSINEFLDKLPTSKRRWADAAVQVFTGLILMVVCYFGVKIVNASWENTLTVLEWSMAWQYMPLPLGSALMIIFVGWDLLQILRGVPREQRYPEA